MSWQTGGIIGRELEQTANDKQYKARVRVAKNPDIGRDLAEKFTKENPIRSG